MLGLSQFSGRRIITPPSQVMEFDPSLLEKHFQCSKEELPQKIEQYVNENNLQQSTKRPTSYIVGDVVLNDEQEPTLINRCDDVDLTIIMLCCSFNGLYIPDRPFNYNLERFQYKVCFIEREVRL